MKGSSLAILLAGKPKGARGEDDGDDAGDTEEGESDYRALAEAAFPNEEWTSERVSALKEFVMSCMEK